MMGKIKLRALTINDLEKTFEWHNEEDIENLYLSHPYPVNIEMEKKWYEQILTSNIPKSVFGIELIENKELIGITVLHSINLINRTAEMGIYLGSKEFRGRGFAREASIETLKFGFYKLGLNRIQGRIIKENVDSLTLCERLGFKREGIFREAIFKNNEFKDLVLVSMLKTEFHE